MDLLRNVLWAIGYNIKILANLNTAAALAFALLCPVFFSFSLLTYGDMARIGEFYLSAMGIILFTPIGTIEERGGMADVCYSKKTPHVYIFAMRMAIMMVFSFLLIFAVTLYGKLQGSTFPMWTVTSGVFISLLFFGMTGMMTASLTGSTAAGYLISFAYFIFEFMTQGKYTGNLFVFSLLNESFNKKHMILALVTVMAALNIVIVHYKGQGRLIMKLE